MPQVINTKCRSCESEIAFSPQDVEKGFTCPHCRKPVPLRMDPSIKEAGVIRKCVACGHDTLYIQKDFNRNLGVGIVVAGCLTALYFFSRSQPVLGMLALVVSSGIDLLLYSIVGEVTVCYSCHAIYRGFARNPEHSTFELKDLEKYGGRDPRF